MTTIATSTAHDDAPDLPQLPFPREGVLTISPLYARLREAGPVTRVRTPAGDVAWLATRYEEAKALFADRRLGRSHPQPDQAARVSDAGVMAGPSGDHEHEDADHSAMRKLLTPAFSAKRMRRLHDRVAELAEGLADDLQKAEDGAVDLHAGFSVPLPIFVICELLGVPVEDRAYFKGLSERMATLTGDDPRVARAEFERYTAGLAEAKRAEPGEDVISDLVAAQEHDPRLTDTRVAELSAGLLFAGHETTVNRLSLGVVLLLVNPEVRDRLVADPAGTVDAVVEEVLRLAEPGGMGLLRYAHEDVTVGEGDEAVTIPRGDAVMIVTSAANRDAEAFGSADAFDPDRSPNPHLSFGHGPHFCIGASLARTELRVGLTTLFTRLPGLRLAVDPEALTLHTERLTGGLDRLPVQVR
ncbi:cytochrome P450 [Actinomycetospora sp. NBRC 106375]|uniref:cytochrome P450 n=1 Tax=Actinomycetospora sp. NBRC 106375 TaxID=3032207 RepID=UPI0024A00E44|nr:cytochrome P450 [Actinomycetospora sp. NBRC 106375]GLZ47683.1 cytochrome P450 [Actinomycetospora sp. NBRC 106375]